MGYETSEIDLKEVFVCVHFRLCTSFIRQYRLYSVFKISKLLDTDEFDVFNCVPYINYFLPMTSLNKKNSVDFQGVFSKGSPSWIDSDYGF